MPVRVACVRQYPEQGPGRLERSRRGIDQFHIVVPVLVPYLIDTAGDHQTGLVDEGYVVAELLDRLHVVRGEHYGRAFFLQFQNLVPDELCIHRIKSGKRLVKYQERRPVHHRGDELYLLGHSLGKLLDFLVPPALDAEFHEP